MKKKILAIILIFFLKTTTLAEGIWSVNGYELSNVNILHKTNTVHVSGRVQNGKSSEYLKLRFLVSNDNGFRGWAETSVQHYEGKGELFEARLSYHRKARIWNIEKIEVTGTSVSTLNQTTTGKMGTCTITSTVPLEMKVYNPDKAFMKSFSVRPGAPYALTLQSGPYRVELTVGQASHVQVINFPPGSSSWNLGK